MWINQGRQRGGVYVKGLSVFQKRSKLIQYNRRIDLARNKRKSGQESIDSGE